MIRISNNRRRTRRGFTLLEVLLVLAILVAIAAIAVPMLMGRAEEGYKRITVVSIRNFEEAAKLYYAENKRMPEGSTDEVLNLLMQPTDEQGNQRSPYLEERPLDGWDRPLQYVFPSAEWADVMISSRPLIWSSGPNGIPGDEDDISNLEEYIQRQTRADQQRL